LIGLT